MKTKKRFFLGVAIDASLWQQPLQRRYDMDDLLINVNIANLCENKSISHLTPIKCQDTSCVIPIKCYFPTQNLLSDAEVTICKYKWLIINVNAFVLG